MARLKDFKSLNPIPPLSFGKHIHSQLIQATFFSFLTCPHQNCLTIPVISSHSPLGSLKQLIVYEGTAWATALVNTSFPALDKSFSFHPASLDSRFRLIFAKVFFLDLPIKEGRPRYYNKLILVIMEIPSKDHPFFFLISPKTILMILRMLLFF